MPKMKTRSAAKKRFRATASGKVKHRKAYTSHILSKKSTKRKRNLRQTAYITSAHEEKILLMIGA